MANLTERIRQAASDASVSGGDTTLRDEFEQFKSSVEEQLQELRNDLRNLLASYESPNA